MVQREFDTRRSSMRTDEEPGSRTDPAAAAAGAWAERRGTSSRRICRTGSQVHFADRNSDTGS